MNFDLQMSSNEIESELYEIVMHLTLVVKIQLKGVDEGKVALLAEVKQAGIFCIKYLEKQQIERVVSIIAPSTLFPYAREAISNLVTKGGFPQIILPPMNFDMLYYKHLHNNKDLSSVDVERNKGVYS